MLSESGTPREMPNAACVAVKAAHAATVASVEDAKPASAASEAVAKQPLCNPDRPNLASGLLIHLQRASVSAVSLLCRAWTYLVKPH